MRRRLARWWPALSSRFGIYPWDLDRLTPAELTEYIQALQQQR